MHALLIRQSGDTEMNLEHKPNPCHSFLICHWNLNSLTAHNHLKVSLLWGCVTIRKLMFYVYRSSHPEVFSGKGVLKICSKFTGEHGCQGRFQ